MFINKKAILSTFCFIIIPFMPGFAGTGNVFNVDLTQNNAGGGTVTGGRWENGWLVTAVLNQRVVWDCGYDISNGSAEVTFSISESPFANEDKTNYFGVFQHPSLNQYTEFADGTADMAYVRTGLTKYLFSRFKVCYRNMKLSDAQCEQSLGSTSDWKVDGTTVHTVSITWQNGKVTYNGPGGPYTYSEPRFNAIRYIFVGACRTYNRCVKGQKFLSVKVTDFDGTATAIMPVMEKTADPVHGTASMYDLLGRRVTGKQGGVPGVYFTLPAGSGAQISSGIIIE